ncbi:MAG: EamA family transporter [Chitinophagales bacterium]
MNESDARPGSVVLAFITVYLVWGSTYFFIRNALNGFPPLILGAFRFITAGLIMMIWAIFKKEKIFQAKAMKAAAISGFFILFIGNGVVIYAEQYVSSAWAAIIISAAPIWFVLFDKFHWKENFRSRSMLAGLVMGIMGMTLLFSENISVRKGNAGQHNTLEFVLLIFASMSWVIGSLYGKYSRPAFPAVISTTWQMFFAGVYFLTGTFFNHEFSSFHLNQVSINAWISIWYLIIFGSILAYSCYIWLMQVRPPAQVSTYAYVNPVVAVLLGVFLADEHISLVQMSGLVVILVSVLLINLNRYMHRSNS